jgi:putative flippase GtrA
VLSLESQAPVRLACKTKQFPREMTRGQRLNWRRQLFRYGVVGVGANAGAFLIYFIATALGSSPVVTITVLYPIQICVAFLLNKRWSFGHEGRLMTSVVKYLFAYAVCYLLNVAVLEAFVGYLGFPSGRASRRDTGLCCTPVLGSEILGVRSTGNRALLDADMSSRDCGSLSSSCKGCVRR